MAKTMVKSISKFEHGMTSYGSHPLPCIVPKFNSLIEFERNETFRQNCTFRLIWWWQTQWWRLFLNLSTTGRHNNHTPLTRGRYTSMPSAVGIWGWLHPPKISGLGRGGDVIFGPVIHLHDRSWSAPMPTWSRDIRVFYRPGKSDPRAGGPHKNSKIVKVLQNACKYAYKSICIRRIRFWHLFLNKIPISP